MSGACGSPGASKCVRAGPHGLGEGTRVRWLLPEASDEAAVACPTPSSCTRWRRACWSTAATALPEAASAFLSDKLADLPDPFRMKGMAAAVERAHPRPAREGEDHPLRRLRRGRGVLHRRCSTSSCGSWAPGRPRTFRTGWARATASTSRRWRSIAADGTRVLVTLDCGITSARGDRPRQGAGPGRGGGGPPHGAATMPPGGGGAQPAPARLRVPHQGAVRRGRGLQPLHGPAQAAARRRLLRHAARSPTSRR